MKSLLLFVVMSLSGVVCLAQTDSPTDTSTTPEKSTLTFGALYSNSVNYYGQRAAVNTPYAAIAASYQLKSGFYLTGLTYKLLNDKSSSVSASSIGAGFNFNMGKKFTTDMSYSHSFFPKYSPLLQAANTDNASLNLSYKSWITPKLTGDFAFGNSYDAFVTGALSKEIDLFTVGQKAIVTITPSASIIAGTQHYYQTYLKEQKLRDSVLHILTDPLFGSSTSSTIDTASATRFNILSYGFKCPIAYNRAHYLIEASYQLSLLSKWSEADPGKLNSFLTVSFYYQF
jgi:hypothetical protein